MAEKTKTKQILLVDEGGTFSSIFSRISPSKKFNFTGLANLRSLLSNEKARILHYIKNQKPVSIYALAKLLKRDFKSVFEDIKLLEKFGFIDLISEKTGTRERLRPVLLIDTLNIQLKI